MIRISLQLKDDVVRRLEHDALNEELSVEAFLEAWLNDWYDFTVPPSSAAQQLPLPTQNSLAFERLRPACDELMF